MFYYLNCYIEIKSLLENCTVKTEDQPPKNYWIDKLSFKDALSVMLENHSYCINSIKSSLTEIELSVEAIYEILKKSNKGRIIYVGSGTSARIGVQDGVELYPTFGWDKKRVDFVVAGGVNALIESVEGAEDSSDAAKEMIKNLKVSSFDVAIILTASGTTPFTISAAETLKSKGVFTVGITNNHNQPITKITDIGIVLDTGYEIIAGSTRLKAGTAQKICLNLISSLVMCRLGYVKNGLMVNMVPNNKKLIDRNQLIKSLLNKQRK